MAQRAAAATHCRTPLILETTVVIPNWNGERWLRGCLDSVLRQTEMAVRILVIDNGSSDRSLELIRSDYPIVEIIELDRNYGFAHAVNRGISLAETEAVALLNTDVELEADWLARVSFRLDADDRAGAVACKMVGLDEATEIYSAGDVLRRDGVCEQRGRFEQDRGQYDTPGEIFAACAGAALYRREAVRQVGYFDEAFFAYLEDVDLGVRLQLAGWTCLYEPAVARHAGEGSSGQLSTPVQVLIERNTLLLVAKYFKPSWLPQVLYRQAAWKLHALRDGTFRGFLNGLRAGLRLLPYGIRARRRIFESASVPIDQVIPSLPIRGNRR